MVRKRDPKTGRFVSEGGGKTKKPREGKKKNDKARPRDPITGKFVSYK